MVNQEFLAIASAVLAVFGLWLLLRLIQWWLNKHGKGIDSAATLSITAREHQKPARHDETMKNKLRRLKDFFPKKVRHWKTKRSADQEELKDIASRLLQMLRQRAVEKVYARKRMFSNREVELLIAALDIAHEKYRESLLEADEKIPKSIQHSLTDFSEAVRNEVRSEFGEKYGLSDQEPTRIKELIAFGDWCKEKDYQLQQAKELIDLGSQALRCCENISGQSTIQTAQLYFNGFPDRWREMDEKCKTLGRDLKEEKKKSEKLAEEPKRLELRIEQLNIDSKSKDKELAQTKKELSKQAAGLKRLEAEKEALIGMNLELKNDSNSAIATLGKVESIASIAEQLQHGSRALFHYMPGGLQSQTALSFLIYYSLFQLSSGIVRQDDLKQQLMLFNLHSVANRCKEYRGTEFVGFSLAYDSLSRNIERDYRVHDVEQKKQELSGNYSFQHADLDFFSQILRDLRSMASMPLSPFYLDANENRPQAAN